MSDGTSHTLSCMCTLHWRVIKRQIILLWKVQKTCTGFNNKINSVIISGKTLHGVCNFFFQIVVGRTYIGPLNILQCSMVWALSDGVRGDLLQKCDL